MFVNDAVNFLFDINYSVRVLLVQCFDLFDFVFDDESQEVENLLAVTRTDR